MKITKKHLFSAFLLSFILFVQFSILPRQNAPQAEAVSKLWNMQKDSGVETIGDKAFGGKTPLDIRKITARVMKAFIGLLGIVFLVLVIFAGVKYMTASGNEDTMKEAISQIKTGVIGLFIVMASYAIASYITDCVLDVTTGKSIWMCSKDYSY